MSANETVVTQQRNQTVGPQPNPVAGSVADLRHVSGHEAGDARDGVPGTNRFLRWSKAGIASTLVAITLFLSCFVMFEPAPVDLFLVGLIVALPLLAQTRPGPIAYFVCALMVANVAVALMGVSMSPETWPATKHVLITLYLALAGFVLAGYVASNPEPRIKVLMGAYTLGCLAAALLAIVGFFSLIPGTNELFTLHDRARGPFKDPNVLGAALVPAIMWLIWMTLAAPPGRAMLAVAASAIIGFAILLTFSRGALLLLAVALTVLALLTLFGAGRNLRRKRFVASIMLGLMLIPVALTAALSLESVQSLVETRFRLDQTYDAGPFGRFGGHERAVGLILENPFGIGTFTFRGLQNEDPHNVYLTQFLNGGWPGGFFYIASILLTLGAGLFAALRGGLLQPQTAVLIATMFGFAALGLIVDTDHWRSFFIVQAALIGVADGRLLAQRRVNANDAAQEASTSISEVALGTAPQVHDPSQPQSAMAMLTETLEPSRTIQVTDDEQPVSPLVLRDRMRKVLKKRQDAKVSAKSGSTLAIRQKSTGRPVEHCASLKPQPAYIEAGEYCHAVNASNPTLRDATNILRNRLGLNENEPVTRATLRLADKHLQARIEQQSPLEKRNFSPNKAATQALKARLLQPTPRVIKSAAS